MAGAPPVVRHLADLSAALISPADTVRLCTLAGPEHGSSASVFLEIWEPGGAQPLNSHEDSAEIFIVLAGTALLLPGIGFMLLMPRRRRAVAG